MRRVIFSLLILVSVAGNAFCQQQDAAALQETAKAFIRQGDNANAILVLNKALAQKPNDLEILKDIVYANYLNHDYAKALEAGKPLPDRPDADVQTYQLMGMVYKAIEERKECEKLYKKGIKTFPNSGVLYNEYGEMLWTKQDNAAITQWEKGIEVDPNFSGNYYYAAKYYYLSKDKIWGLLYGEIFVNLESYSKRTAEIKTLLLNGYKKLFTDNDIAKNQNSKNNFVNASLDDFKKQSSVITSGVSVESLAMLRARFILDWYDGANANKYPFKLFDYQRQLLKDGFFDAYNQWLFGATENLVTYQSWTTIHSEQYNNFNNFQKNRVFKMPAGQYYQTK